MNIIIDGYNLIRQSDSLRRFERFSLEEGRKELIRRLSHFRKLKGHKITVVFDGWINGSPREERHNETGITIIYSKRGEKADEVIKRMARGSDREIIVVTSDRDIADSISRNGGVAISSPEFEARIQTIEAGGPDSYEGKGLNDDDDDERTPGKKKGPSKRLSRKKRKASTRLRKL
jgi:hypothetical protein